MSAGGNGRLNAFLRDLEAGTTELVNVALGGGFSADGESRAVALTPSGRYALVWSSSSDLTANDGNGRFDAFIRDLQTGVTELVSVNLAGTGSAGGDSGPIAMTPDGRYVLFQSWAHDLVSMPTGDVSHVYVRDRQANTTTLVSVNAAGNAGAERGATGVAISASGRYVTISSDTPDLVPGDDNGLLDVFVRDLQTGTTTMVSRNAAGTGGGNGYSSGGALSADGRYVLFASYATDVVPNDGNQRFDVYRRDLKTGTTQLVSVNAAGTAGGNADSHALSMSADGLLVLFESTADDLAAGDLNQSNDVFLRDLQTGTTSLVSATPAGAAGNWWSWGCCLSADGTRLTFRSVASDLVANDFNGSEDVFVAATGRTSSTLPFADGFEGGDLWAWAAFVP